MFNKRPRVLSTAGSHRTREQVIKSVTTRREVEKEPTEGAARLTLFCMCYAHSTLQVETHCQNIMVVFTSFLALFFVVSVVATEPEKQEYVTIDTDLGRIRGTVKTARNGDKFEAFLGVPFAKAPLDDLRWEPPQPADPWDGVLDATKNPSLCFQDDVNKPSKYHGSEDCLYVNVFTKSGSDAKKKHTMVWFHGGAFIFGGIDYYNADYVMENDDVILVTVQYRLNAFGFMSTEDENLAGNYGSLDQVQALQWVHDHIDSFGGQPDQVTIFGMSAGGASVEYLTLSPLTRNLYKNSISLSGSSLCWWASIPHPRNQALKLAKRFDCPTDQGSKVMISCLKKVHGHKLMAAQKEVFFDWHHNQTEREPMNLFSPRSDPEREHPFLPNHPYFMLKNGDYNAMPHMMGYSDMEGIWRANQLLPDDNNSPIWADFLHHYDKVAPMAYGLMDGQVKDANEVARQVTKFYKMDEDLREVHLTDEKIRNIVDVLSDTMFNYAIDESVKLRAKHKRPHGHLSLHPYLPWLYDFG